MSDQNRGLLYGFIASALWSSVFVAARYVTVIRGVDPYYSAALRFGSGAVVASVYLLVAGKARHLLAARRDLGWMILLGGIGIFGMGELVFISSTLTSSINSALLLNTNAVFIAVFALFVGERVPAIRFVGLLIGLVGCAMIVFGSAQPQTYPPVNNLLGSLAAFGGAICWALYTVLGKRIVRRDGGPEVATATLITGALMLAVVALIRTPDFSLRLPEALASLYLGVFPTAIAMLLWYRALELVDASVLGPTQYLAPIGATLLGWGLLGEEPTWTFASAALAIVVGMYLATRTDPEPS